MEGLIKDLIDVTIGHNDDNNNDDHRNNQQSSESIEQTSRSTWAQVVSGEQDDADDHHEDHNNRRTHHHTQSHHRPNTVGEGYEDSGYSGSRPSYRPQQPTHGSYQPAEDHQRHNYNQDEKEEQQENADGWETAHGKHHKRQPKKVRMDHWSNYKLHPNEQQYSEEVNYDKDPSNDEIDDYKKACAKLWELDLNRLRPGKDYEINVGEGKKVYNTQDMADENLFTWVSEEVLRKPTFSRFFALLDNYNPHEGCKEHVTSEDIQEQTAFIEEISRTAPIKYLYKYLNSAGIFTEDYQEFKRMLKDLWFTLYGRGGTAGSSSSFEHVFVGEIKDRGEQKVSGFHNWLQFYLEEAKGKVDYQGFILPRRHGEFVSGPI